MMTRYIVVITALIFTLSCSGENRNKSSSNPENTKGQITVSILPQKYFVEKIAGELYDVQVMIPSGSSPATYSPAPGQMRKLEQSLAYMRIGHIVFEKSWIKNIRENFPKLKIYDTSEGVEMLGAENSGKDPHIWLSVKAVRIQARNILKALVEISPGRKDMLDANYERFDRELAALETEIRQRLDGLETRTFMAFHPAWSYFARDFNLIQIAIEHEGKEPNPREMLKVIKRAIKEKIEFIIVQKQFDQQKARVIAREIKGRVVGLDPLAENWKNNMLHIADVFRVWKKKEN